MRIDIVSTMDNSQLNLSCLNFHSPNIFKVLSPRVENWWHQVDQQNTGIRQGQLSNVNVKGNDNRVTVNQGQSVQGCGDTSGGGSGDLPTCHILCALVK
jgi:hypothetical protein